MSRTLQLGQTYITRDGKGSGRVVADDITVQPFSYSVVFTDWRGVKTSRLYAANGRLYISENPEDLIIPERKMRTVWLNYDLRAASDGCITSRLFDSEQGALRNNAGWDVQAHPVEVPAE